MPTNVNATIKKLAPAKRKNIEARAARLIAEEMNLRQVRTSRKQLKLRTAPTVPTSNQDHP